MFSPWFPCPDHFYLGRPFQKSSNSNIFQHTSWDCFAAIAISVHLVEQKGRKSDFIEGVSFSKCACLVENCTRMFFKIQTTCLFAMLNTLCTICKRHVPISTNSFSSASRLYSFSNSKEAKLTFGHQKKLVKFCFVYYCLNWEIENFPWMSKAATPNPPTEISVIQ